MANVASLASAARTAGNGMLRLAPTLVPRLFLQLGRRLKLHPDDYYALGMHRGGIDERWFGSTTEAANDNRIGKLTLQSPSMIRFGGMTEDAVFVTAKAAPDGVEFEKHRNGTACIASRLRA